MAEEDLLVWDDRREGRGRKRKRKQQPVVFALPDNPKDLAAVGPELSLVRFSTRSGVHFLNPSFDHLRLLWFGCSLHRILSHARQQQLDIDALIALNVGDEWVEQPAFPIWSKGRMNKDPLVAEPPPGSSRKQKLDIMIPYEELLWNYRPVLMKLVPFSRKKPAVVFRGGCTHPFRREMVRTVRNSLPKDDQADVQVSCMSPYSGLAPADQARYRCLLDYDGRSYSRRTAWYLETGSVVLRGGIIDDVLSRLARRRKRHDQAHERNHRQAWTDDESLQPIVFWKDHELVPMVQRCLADEEWGAAQSQSSARFWKKYVENGQAVWDGYLLHLLVEQSRRFSLVLQNADAYDSDRQGSSFPVFSTLSSTMVCPLIADGAIPTGESGELQWNFVLRATILSLSVLYVSYRWLVPLLLARLPRSLGRVARACWKRAYRGTRTAQPPCSRRTTSPTPRALVTYLVQQDWIADGAAARNFGHEREE
jgi:hypothetical protein